LNPYQIADRKRQIRPMHQPGSDRRQRPETEATDFDWPKPKQKPVQFCRSMTLKHIFFNQAEFRVGGKCERLELWAPLETAFAQKFSRGWNANRFQ
jgi:hypothetical protein